MKPIEIAALSLFCWMMFWAMYATYVRPLLNMLTF